MTFRKYDAGVVDRPKGAPKTDCQVRALATARSMPYRDAWALLYTHQGERFACAFQLLDALAHDDPRFGVIGGKSFPAVKGKRRMTVAEFCRKYPRGRWILRCAGHVVAVKDGTFFDTGDCSHSCVYLAWEVSEYSVTPG